MALIYFRSLQKTRKIAAGIRLMPVGYWLQSFLHCYGIILSQNLSGKIIIDFNRLNLSDFTSTYSFSKGSVPAQHYSIRWSARSLRNDDENICATTAGYNRKRVDGIQCVLPTVAW